MSTLADAMLAWKVNLTTKVVPEQVLTLRVDVNAFADDVRLLESENAKLLRELEAEHALAETLGHMHERAKDEADKLRDENAKLREDIDRLIQAVEDLHDVSLEDRLVQLENENAKLRELAEMLYECPKAPECNECKHLNGGDYACAYLMRELGIEVE